MEQCVNAMVRHSMNSLHQDGSQRHEARVLGVSHSAKANSRGRIILAHLILFSIPPMPHPWPLPFFPLLSQTPATGHHHCSAYLHALHQRCPVLARHKPPFMPRPTSPLAPPHSSPQTPATGHCARGAALHDLHHRRPVPDHHALPPSVAQQPQQQPQQPQQHPHRPHLARSPATPAAPGRISAQHKGLGLLPHLPEAIRAQQGGQR